jgi:hypothetical protein
MNNIIVQDVGAEKDAITSLRAPTHFGRPNWDKIFGSIGEKHPESDVGVVSLFRFALLFLHLKSKPSSSAVPRLLPAHCISCRTSIRMSRARGSSLARVRCQFHTTATNF